MRGDAAGDIRPGTRWFAVILAAIWLAIAGAALLYGWDYYVTPFQERPYSPLHSALKPTGTIGHGFGVVGTAMMAIGVVLYLLRKRVGFLAGFGKLRYWLEFHIFLCTLGPFFVLLHTTFKFGGIVSIAFWSMTVVVASGVFGRYVYARIPKTISGSFRSAAEVGVDREHLIDEIRRSGVEPARLAELPAQPDIPEPASLTGAIGIAVRGDFQRRRYRRDTTRALKKAGVPAAVRKRLVSLLDRQLRLEQQSRLLVPFQRLFGYWHVLHLPLAIVLLVVAIVHVGVAILFGYGWSPGS